MIGRQRKGDETQATKPPWSELKRGWPLIALAVVVGALIMGELAFQWARHRGWTTYTPDTDLARYEIRSIALALDGALWFAPLYGGVSRFDGGTWTTYSVADGLAANMAASIAVAADGTVWVGAWDFIDGDGGVSHFDGESWTTYREDDGLADNAVTSIAVAPDGVVWVGTWEGVSRFDGKSWTTHTTADGLPDETVTTIAVAPDGTVWAGIDNNSGHGGVSRFDGETWTTYTKNDGLADNDVTVIAIGPDGTVWAGSKYDSVSRFNGETWTVYTTADGLYSGYVRSIAVAPDGVVWIGAAPGRDTSCGGVSRLDGQTWTTYTGANSGLACRRVLSLAIDSQGQVWMGTDDGLSMLGKRKGLPAQTLYVFAQVWGVVRMVLGIAMLLLLPIAWIVRRLQAMPAEQRRTKASRYLARAVRGAVVLGLIGGVAGAVLPGVSLFMLHGSGHGGLAGTDTILEWVCEALLAPGRVFFGLFPAGEQWEFGWGNVLGYGIIGALVGAWLGMGISLRRDRGARTNSSAA